MTEPEAHRHTVVSSHEKHKGHKNPPYLFIFARDSDGRETAYCSYETKEIEKKRQILARIWMYLSELFQSDKAAFWIMVFTGALVVVTIGLIQVTNKVDETARQVQRAFIHSTGITPAPRIADFKTNKIAFAGFNVGWKNTGATPTRNATTHTSVHFRKDPLPKGFDFPDLYPDLTEHVPGHVVIGPQGNLSTTPINVSIQQVQAVHDRTGHLYFWGWVEYNDIFKGTQRHITKFCLEVTDVSTLNPAITDLTDPQGAFSAVQSICPENNCYDKECEKKE